MELPWEIKNFNSPYVFLDTIQKDKDNHRSFVFDSCYDILAYRAYDDFEQLFKKIDDYLKRGFWLAGYFCYEFGYTLEERLFNFLKREDSPLVWLGVFKSPKIINHPYQKDFCPFKKLGSPYFITNLSPNIEEEEYVSSIQRIKRYLKEGETYQVNFTFKLKFDFKGNPIDLYSHLRNTQPTSYSAFIRTNSDYILSFSPELFFRWEKNRIITKPMKGTIERGRFLQEDKLKERLLKMSEKNRAENLMIVDLLRNDLGKIAKKGGVKVKELFTIEKYFTVFQMTSTIQASLKSTLNFQNIIKAIFPSGSVTGAPKVRTMQIIYQLEKEPRGVYTGAIGYISPNREACFNVAIRTIHIDKDGKGSLGIGGGVVYDSIDKKEYKEAILKAQFLTEDFREFFLIETILWEKENFYLLNLHLSRLENSCRYFDIPFSRDEIKRKLFLLEKNFDYHDKYKFRLLMDRRGKLYIEYSLLSDINLPIKVKLSKNRVNSKNRYLYHKTTLRDIYDKEIEIARKQGFSEVIFTNEYSQLTEGTFTNIFLLIKGELYTPKLECGLLPGVFREYLLKSKQAKEKVLYPKDILEAEKFFLGNSLRGLMEGVLINRVPLVKENKRTEYNALVKG
ncbi:MAG: aminodeoxychorismate synthase component I [Candidatus Omnitrophica bacterium]|nr:aminodeoxychorismate synthase component I [Candidatus Omnitrophota bacterium]